MKVRPRSGFTLSEDHKGKISKAHIENHLKDKGTCRTCKETIIEKDAVKWVLKKGQWACLKCERQRCKAKQRRYRIELFQEYGGRCVCCGESQLEFLTIDHINGDGHLEKKRYKLERGKQLNFYNWIKRNNYPKDKYRILCWNCNLARAKYGSCPHEREAIIVAEARLRIAR